jgi:methylase of polypeptide subunit release factors
MKTATANKVSYTFPPANSLDLNRVLLSGMLVVQGESISSIRSKSGRLKLLRLSADALSVLDPKSYRKFTEWAQELDPDDPDTAPLTALQSNGSAQEIFNGLGNALFDEEAAKVRGAIFTPPWVAKRLVSNAIGHWSRLNVGRQPSLAADLSCGPGVFLSELASKFSGRTKIIGVDACPEYVALARLLTSRHGNVEAHCADTLLTLRSFGQLTFEAAFSPVASTGYDIIVGNPPYVRCQSLDAEYARTLREIYPSFTGGNFDLASLFLAHTLEALAPGGVAALVISSKFMTSRYGAEVCRRLGQHARMLEIVDFGDGQIFEGRTTYTCTLTFAKLAPLGSCKVLKFPSGLKWNDGESHLAKARVAELPSERFRTAPWELSSGVHDDILNGMRRPECARLSEIFPNFSQGIRTGANQFFVISTATGAALEQDLILPYISGENIRSCRILAPEYSLIWPYRFTDVGTVVAIREDELVEQYPRATSYFNLHRKALASRELEQGAPWYSYSRSQNLDLAHRPKVIGRELMPRAEFAADLDGRYAICSGYALLPPSRMPKAELEMWAAVLSSQTMEFQLRHVCTQLHSGWFRILKQHLNAVHVPPFSKADREEALKIAAQIHGAPDDRSLRKSLDNIVARAFGLTDIQRSQIESCVQQHHSVSTPKGLFDSGGEVAEQKVESQSNVLSGSSALVLSNEEKKKYMPVELPEYYRLHVERDNLGQAVTFVDNKTKPIHRWYSFTQGFSTELVSQLLSELGASGHSRVYDPFAGSGTTLLTCKEAGISSFGSEISPLMCWVSRLKANHWEPSKLKQAIASLDAARPTARNVTPPVFQEYLSQAFAPQILSQIFAWRDWIENEIEQPVRDFLLLGLISILESVSQLRKHGSHYRFLNKTESVGLAKLNIPVIDSGADLKPILVGQLENMFADVRSVPFPSSAAQVEIFNIDSRLEAPSSENADCVITSPPYLNRNMYFAQQKAELVLLNFINTYEDYRALVRRTLRSHVEGALPAIAESDIPEVQAIVDCIQLTENNNAKIPQMVCGYFKDLQNTLATLRNVLSRNAGVAFVVGNCRWGGVVVPVDHLLAMLAEQLGYRAEKIIVTRLKGNSPQQMRRYGKIPLRESIVLLRWPGNA